MTEKEWKNRINIDEVLKILTSN